MRSRAEWAARGLAIALLGWALAAAIGSAGAGDRRAGAGRAATLRLGGAGHRSTEAARAVASATRDPELVSLHARFDAAPGAAVRDWLRAIAGAGTAVTWSGDLVAAALTVEPLRDPRGGALVTVAAPDGWVEVRDAAGMVDSLAVAAGGASLRLPTVVGEVTATVGGTVARDGLRDTASVREVVLLGRAGWEGKFVAAALEEHGWRVRPRFAVAPGLDVAQGPLDLDTARVSAVVAIDSSAARHADAIAGFVRAGGGLVLGATAAHAPGLAALAAGRTGPLVRGTNSFAAAVAPVRRATLDAYPIAPAPEAVVLESRGGAAVVAARRVEAGRVAQSGYDESWRWRMAGAEDAPAAHREFWARLVETVAYAPVARADSPAARDADPAPLAATVAALGPPVAAPPAGGGEDRFDPARSIWVYISAVVLLLAEWLSRRLRGAR